MLGSGEAIALVRVSLLVLAAGACGYGPLPPRQCNVDMDCLQAARYGSCLPSPLSAAQWCAFPSDDCPETGLKWGIRAGDGLTETCVGEPDAGPADGAIDAVIPDAPPVPDATPPDAVELLDMVTIPSTSFMMGCNATVDDLCMFATMELPYHYVELTYDYQIDRTEVSQAAYELCVASTICTPPAGDYDPVATPNLPVVSVTWFQAVEFCGWVGKRLPTEAEWELAARGTDGRKFPWGNSDPSCSQALYLDCPGTPVEVSSFPDGASPYGALHMADNVSEWINDWYDEDYYVTSPATNPLGPSSGLNRGRRGGFGDFDVSYLRVSGRYAYGDWMHAPGFGFRCSRTL